MDSIIKKKLKTCKLIDVDKKNKYNKFVNKYYIWDIKKNTFLVNGNTQEIAWENAENYFKNTIKKEKKND